MSAKQEGLEQLLTANLRKQRQDLEDALAGSSAEGDEQALQQQQAAAEAVGGALSWVLLQPWRLACCGWPHDMQPCYTCTDATSPKA